VPDEYGDGEASTAAEENTPVQAVQGEDAGGVMAGGLLGIRLPEWMPLLRQMPEIHRLPNEMPARHPRAAGAG
jgi:hypothetical protein